MKWLSELTFLSAAPKLYRDDGGIIRTGFVQCNSVYNLKAVSFERDLDQDR